MAASPGAASPPAPGAPDPGNGIRNRPGGPAGGLVTGPCWHARAEQSTGHLVCSSPGAGQGPVVVGWVCSGIVAQ
jgi:hypothetical protein